MSLIARFAAIAAVVAVPLSVRGNVTFEIPTDRLSTACVAVSLAGSFNDFSTTATPTCTLAIGIGLAVQQMRMFQTLGRH